MKERFLNLGLFFSHNMAKESSISIPSKGARKAAEHIRSIHGVTPILPLETLVRDGVVINLSGKFENVQSMYTFKARGAEWFVYGLMKQYVNRSGRFRNDDTEPVLVTASAGNHAQGVALAAKRYGIEAIIFMPTTTPDVKTARVDEVGGNIKLVGEVFDDSLKEALKFKRESPNRIFVPPYEHPQIMAGQATVGVELLSQACPLHPDYMRVAEYDWSVPDVIISGLGGGGLISGIGAVVQEFNKVSGKNIRAIGVQTEAADSMYQSVKAGEYRPSSDMATKSVADGIAVKEASLRMMRTVKEYVDQVVLVTEEDIIRGLAYINQHPNLKERVWRTQEVNNPAIPFRNLPKGAIHVYAERPLNRVEGAAAAPYAAVVLGDKHGEIDWREIAGDRKELNVVCVLTGSNIPTKKLTELTEDITRPRDL